MKVKTKIHLTKNTQEYIPIYLGYTIWVNIQLLNKSDFICIQLFLIGFNFKHEHVITNVCILGATINPIINSSRTKLCYWYSLIKMAKEDETVWAITI